MSQKTKTIYVRKESEDLWKQVESLLDDQSLAGLVEDLLRRYVQSKTSTREGRFEYFQFKVRPQDSGSPFLNGIEKKIFQGHLLVNGDRSIPRFEASDDKALFYFIAISPKGKIVFWNQKQNEIGPDGVRDAEYFRVYKDLQDAATDYPPEDWPGEHEAHRTGKIVLNDLVDPAEYWYALIPPAIIQKARSALEELGYEYNDVLDI